MFVLIDPRKSKRFGKVQKMDMDFLRPPPPISDLQIREMKKGEERDVHHVFKTMGAFVRQAAFVILLLRKITLIMFCSLTCIIYSCLSSEYEVSTRLIPSLIVSGIFVIAFYKYEAYKHFSSFENGTAAEMSIGCYNYWSQHGRELLVAVHSEKIVGIVAIDKTSEPNKCEIKRMVVLPEYRRMGVGKKLMLAAEEMAISLGYLKVFLETGRFQAPAIMFYMRMKYNRMRVVTPEDNGNLISMKFKVYQFEKDL